MKKYWFYLIIVAFLTVLVIFFNEYKKGTTLGKRDSGFSITRIDKISEIIITGDHGKVNLASEQGKWIANSNFEADKKAVDLILKTLERLRVKGPAPSAIRNELLEKLKNESVRIDVYKGRRCKTFYLYSEGKYSPTYMIIQGSDKPFIAEVIGFEGHVASLFALNESHFRTNILFNYKPYNIAEVFVKHKEDQKGSFILNKIQGEEFNVYNYSSGKRKENINDSLVIRYLANFYYTPYERLATAEERVLTDSLKKSEADYIIRVTDFDGEINEVFFHKIIKGNKEGSDTPDYDIFRLYALINDKSEMIVVPYHSVDLLLRTYSYF